MTVFRQAVLGAAAPTLKKAARTIAVMTDKISNLPRAKVTSDFSCKKMTSIMTL